MSTLFCLFHSVLRTRFLTALHLFPSTLFLFQNFPFVLPFPLLMISSLFPLYSFRATQVGCRFWSNLVWTRTLISLTPACSSSWMSSVRRSAGRSARSWKSKRAPRTCVEQRQIREMLSRSDQVSLLSTKLWAQASMNDICNITTTHNRLKRCVFTAGSPSGRSSFLSCLGFILKPHLSLSHSSFLIMQEMTLTDILRDIWIFIRWKQPRKRQHYRKNSKLL